MKYRYDAQRGEMVGEDGLPMLNQAEKNRPPQCPRVFGDYDAYQSPIDGSWVDGRRSRRYDLEKNNCIDGRDVKSPTDGALRNHRFAQKRGLEHLLKDRQ
jgi:hypothetical protein